MRPNNIKQKYVMRKLLFTLCACLSVITVNAQEIQPKPEKAVRIMSYNIRNCIGMDEKMDIDRLAGVLNNSLPDVAALQEVDSVTTRTGKLDILGELAGRTGLYATFAGAIDFQGGKYGVGILSKEKPLSHKSMPLPGREEERVLLIAEFKNYYVCCTHLSLTKEDRETSVRLITERLNGLNTKKPVFLAGDMNARPDSHTTELFEEHFYMLSDPSQATFPSDDPKGCIDYIYQLRSKRKAKVLGYQVIYGTTASDHLPIFNDIVLKK